MRRMAERIRKIFEAVRTTKNKSVSMRRRLMLYWCVMILTAGAMLLFILSFTGVFSDEEQKFREGLAYQMDHIEEKLSGHMDELNAQSILLSMQISSEITQLLEVKGLTADDLNDQPELLEQLQFALYEKLYTTLSVSDCSGAYFLLDATVNTKAEGAEHSRSGMYLRYANLNDKNAASKDIVYFRGIPDVARSEHLELHNRWELEVDISLFPSYEELMHRQADRLAQMGRWTAKFPLTSTWEDVMLLTVPVLDAQGTICGLCGVEIGALYFQLSYPAPEKQESSMLLLLAPQEKEGLIPKKGMISSEMYTEFKDSLTIHETYYYDVFKSGDAEYVGSWRTLSELDTGGAPLCAALLVPKHNFQKAVWTARLRIASVFLIFLIIMIILSVYLTWRFMTPILTGLRVLQTEELCLETQTGVSEIDMLVNYIQTRADAHTGEENSLPPEIEELFTAFANRSKTLTTAEKGILHWYIDGHEASEIAEKAFISMSTVRKHSGNIYRKLNVASKDELMLYVELFRRCGRLEELL